MSSTALYTVCSGEIVFFTQDSLVFCHLLFSCRLCRKLAVTVLNVNNKGGVRRTVCRRGSSVVHWIGKNTVFNEHLVDTITIHASISSPAEEMPDEETIAPIIRVLLFKKVNFVPVFPELVPI